MALYLSNPSVLQPVARSFPTNNNVDHAAKLFCVTLLKKLFLSYYKLEHYKFLLVLGSDIGVLKKDEPQRITFVSDKKNIIIYVHEKNHSF